MPFTTVEIVDHLKCEARFAMIDKVIDKLENNSLTGLEHDQLVYLGQKIHEDNDFILNENLKNLPGAKAKEFYRRYIGATIAFEFSLASYQENSNSTEVDFARVITNGTVSVPFSASNDQMRQSTRTFQIVDSFDNILKLQKCERSSMQPNLEYPVSGSVGLSDIISTFIDLNEKKDLTPKASADGVYVDALLFTTTASASVVPKLVLTPPTQAFHLTGASLNTAATRRDTDSLTVAMALPATKKEGATTAPGKKRTLDAIEHQRSVLVQNSIIQFFSNH